MRAFFIALVALHGLIHLIGFGRSIGLGGAGQPVSRELGIVWLLAAVGFVTAALLLVFAPRFWWVPAVPALVLSQIAVISAWSEAKFGTIVNAVILVPLALAVLDQRESSLRSRYEADVRTEFGQRPAAAIVTEGDLAPLPPLVQTYLRRVGVIGQPRVHDLFVRFRGELRNGVDGRWMKMRAEQRERFEQPTARLFFVNSSLYGVPFKAYHRFVGSTATMEVSAASLAKVADARGPEMNQSETVTLFNDICLFAPAALLDADVAFNTVDNRTVHATFHNGGVTIHADLIFKDDGDLVNFVSRDRYMTTDGKTMEKYPWSTPIRDYKEFGGMRVASHGEAVWTLPGGDFTYARFDVEELRYNVVPEARAEEQPRISLRGALQH